MSTTEPAGPATGDLSADDLHAEKTAAWNAYLEASEHSADAWTRYCGSQSTTEARYAEFVAADAAYLEAIGGDDW